MEENEQPMQENTETPAKPSVQAAKNPNLNAALSYVLGAITGIIFLLIEKENEFVRFNAAQSTVLSLGFWIIGFIPFINFLLILIGPLGLILWIYLIYKAYQGDRVELPVVSDLAKKLEQAI